jgi:NAD(P)-dependent dehydrogenase (short-subunit alcohol dehydrogenase family)
MSIPTNTAVHVVIGAGSIGQAIARRTGAGKHVLLADFNETNLQNAKTALEDAGHTVSTQRVDVSDRDSVAALARAAAGLGDVVQVVSTAGVSPVQAPAEAVLAVDLYGTAVVLEEFGKVIAPGGAGVHISSMAGHMPPPLDPETAHALAFTPVEELLALPVLAPDAVPNSGAAYAISKQANHLRVQAAAVPWGDRGARVNCISPGIILTPLARDEMSGPGAAGYQKMIEVSAAGRVGTADEVATAAAFLLGPDAGFITGTDLLIDGGVIAALRAGRWQFGV